VYGLGNAQKNAESKKRQAEWRRLRPDRTVVRKHRQSKSSRLRQIENDPKGFRERVAEYGRRWRSENPDKMRAAWLNRRADLMAARYGQPYLPQTAEVYQAVVDGACFGCGQQPAGSIDHIIPFSRGGTNAENNLQPACLPCNLRKGAS
jgi:5-methylcytosine-specific restriction endonuclease McrA